jgi:hypothetical protein
MTELHFESEKSAFARGGNRVCFIDPRNHQHCIKVARADRAPAIKKSEKRFPASLKPLHSFDDNYEEFRVYQQIQSQIGDNAYQFIPRCFGFVETNLGPGLCSEIITDDDGKISLTLKQYLWQKGFTDELQVVVEKFQQQWGALGMPSRNLLLHNIVVQQRQDKIVRLVVIDGLGWPDLIPFGYFFPLIAKRKARRKAARLTEKIEELLEKQRSGGDWGYHGWMEDVQRTIK